MSSKEAVRAVESPAFNRLKSRFSGAILFPGDEGFEGFKSSPAGQPVFTARALTPDDVAEAIAYARAEGVPISVRSGGHTGGSWTTAEGGFVLDLAEINSIEVSDDARVRLGSGAHWGDIAKELGAHSLALSSGDTTTVGVGGLTLGGGIGWMVRTYGLAMDDLVAVEMVTASGEKITVSAEENADLFWALRGGGGNFGVVTHFTFRAHPLSTVFAGAITYDIDDLASLLRGWRDVMRQAPEQLNSTFLAMPAMGPEMPASTQILVCFAGNDETAAMAAIEPLLALDGVRGHDIREKSYADVLDDPHPPEGPMIMVAHNGFLPDFSDEGINSIAAMHSKLGGAVLMVRALSGAFNRVEANATAFAFRDSEVLVISAAFLPADAPAEATEHINDLWRTLSPYVRGAYANFTTEIGEHALAAIYPPATRARLAVIKHRFDPENLFSQNMNILPSASAMS